jgi:hypothetical protein
VNLHDPAADDGSAAIRSGGIDPLAALERDRHIGRPLMRLDDVRSDHNVVAAVEDVVAARSLIVALEQSGTDPDRISLLGAWPVSKRPALPRAAATSGALGAAAGTVVGMVLGAITRIRTRWTVVVGGLAGALVGARSATGSSPAWRRSLLADGRGPVVVGVHSPDPVEVAEAEITMHRHGARRVNRFDGSRRRGAG